MTRPPRSLRWLLLFVAGLALAPAVARAQASSAIRVTVVDAQSNPVADAVVVAVSTDPSVAASARPRAESLDQIDKEFVPKVKAVLVGSTVAFPNRDNVRHHVYSFSPTKRFELPLYAGMPAQPVLFDKPGVVVLGCNIHDWMIGYIYVSESPFFAKTDAHGGATIADLPARTFVVRVWHPQMKGSEADTRREVTLAPGRNVELQVTLALAPLTRVRRAPGAEHGAHY
jgi:plastocyanin